MKWTEAQLADYQRRHGVPSGRPNTANVSAPPFASTAEVVLDLPPPVSVNRSRKIDWAQHKKVTEWIEFADKYMLAAKARGEIRFDRIPRYELHITLSEDHVDIDGDNGLKLLIDYLRQRDITSNDGKKQMRKLTVEWGYAPAGVRIVVKPLTVNAVLKRAAERMEVAR